MASRVQLEKKRAATFAAALLALPCLATIAAAAPTSTAMAAGDRIVFVVEIRNVGGGWGGNGARSVELHYDGAAASDGRVVLSLDLIRDALRKALAAMLPPGVR